MIPMPLFAVPILVGLLTQAVKPVLNKDWFTKIGSAGRAIPRYGGMPSAHTAFAASLITVIAYADGFFSTTFVIATVMVILILDDALRMRIFLGRYGQALRVLISKLPESDQKRFPYLEERLGHKLSEVVVGAIVGIILTFLILYFFPT